MKKTILLIAVWVCFIGHSWCLMAQNEEAVQAYQTEVGLNVSNFVKSFLSLNTQTIQASPYFVIVKRKSLRLHLGLRANDGRNFFDDSNNITDSRRLQFDFKAGVERKQNVAQKWIFHYGLDLVGSYRYNRFNTLTSIDEIKDQTEAAYAGISPFLGLQFKINNRLKVLTEANWVIAYGRSTEKIESAFFPDDLNEINISNFAFTELNPPVDVYLIFKF